MQKTTVAVLGGAFLALVLAVAAGAEPPATEGRGGMGPRVGGVAAMSRFLGLSAEQQTQVQKLMDSQRPDHEALREKVAKNRADLQQALEGGNPDPAAVGELAIEGHRLHEQGRALREAQDKAVRALLTPEQQVKFDAMKALRDEGMRGGPMSHGAMPPGGGEGWRRP
jgi:Spy/CpxP family protein refolding chaperone